LPLRSSLVGEMTLEVRAHPDRCEQLIRPQAGGAAAYRSVRVAFGTSNDVVQISAGFELKRPLELNSPGQSRIVGLICSVIEVAGKVAQRNVRA